MRSVLRTLCCLILLIAVAGVASGCGGKEKDAAKAPPAPATAVAVSAPPPATSKPPAPAAAPPAAAPAPGPGAGGDFSLSIVPISPRTTDCLQAVLGNVRGSMTYRWERNGKLIVGADTLQLCGERLAKRDVITFTAAGASGTQSSSVTVANTAPRVARLYWRPANVKRGIDLVAAPEGFDPDGDAVSFRYRWLINGVEMVGTLSNVLPGAGFRGGDRIVVEVTPLDGEQEGEVYKSGELTVGNSPPRIVTTAPNTVVGETYIYEVKAEDPDGEALVYRLENAPKGMTIDAATGRIEWPLAEVPDGSHAIKVVVQDPPGATNTQEFSLDLKKQ